MRRHGIDVSLVEQGFVGAGVMGQHPLDQVGLAHQLAAPAHGRGLGGRCFRRRDGERGCSLPKYRQISWKSEMNQKQKRPDKAGLFVEVGEVA